MIGAGIGLGLKAIGGIFGGIKASKAMRQVRDSLNEQRQRNADWYNRRYNEDATQRADAQAVLAKTEESIRNRNRQAAGAQAVMGGTEEAVAAAKEANNRALADATTAIAANAERRKDMIESQYHAKDDALQQQINDLNINKSHAVSQAVGGVSSAGTNIAGLF